MEQINASAFYLLGKWLDSSFLSARLPVKSNINAYYSALALVDILLAGDGRYKLDESRKSAMILRTALAEIVALHTANPDATLTDEQLRRFNDAFGAFDQALVLELGRAPIFFVTPKGVFDTRRLIVDATLVYESLRGKIPEAALRDTAEAGRCLAFAVPTAAGFHIARATETVIKLYMEGLGCKPTAKNWGTYIHALQQRGANEKVTACLRQIKDLHRNPLMHPDVSLTLTEALTLWSICVSAIQAMIADRESRSESPLPEIVNMLPKSETE